MNTGPLYYSTALSSSPVPRVRAQLVSERNACNFQTIHLYVIKKGTLLPIKLTFHFLLLRGMKGRGTFLKNFIKKNGPEKGDVLLARLIPEGLKIPAGDVKVGGRQTRDG